MRHSAVAGGRVPSRRVRQEVLCMERSRRRRRLLGGALAGGLAGVVTGAVLASAAPAVHELGEPDIAPTAIIDAAHVPPLLTLPGEPVTLRYAIVCPGGGADPFESA